MYQNSEIPVSAAFWAFGVPLVPQASVIRKPWDSFIVRGVPQAASSTAGERHKEQSSSKAVHVCVAIIITLNTLAQTSPMRSHQRLQREQRPCTLCCCTWRQVLQPQMTKKQPARPV